MSDYVERSPNKIVCNSSCHYIRDVLERRVSYGSSLGITKDHRRTTPSNENKSLRNSGNCRGFDDVPSLASGAGAFHSIVRLLFILRIPNGGQCPRLADNHRLDGMRCSDRHAAGHIEYCEEYCVACSKVDSYHKL